MRHSSENLNGDIKMRDSGDVFDVEARPSTSSRLVQWALQDVIQEAKKSGKLVCGVHSAAEELEIDCSQMLLCVLVVNPQVDPGTQIHCHLIDAFCWDVRIPVLRVDSARKLRHVTGMSFAHPVHCLLVKDLEQKSRSLETLLSYARSSPGAFLKIV